MITLLSMPTPKRPGKGSVGMWSRGGVSGGVVQGGVSGGVVQGRGQYVCDLDPLQLALVVLIINRHTRGLDGMREHVHDQII